MSKRWNPRYVAYAHAHGRGLAQMRKHDRKRWPGGYACGFTLWIRARWAEWCKLAGVPRHYATLHQEEFDAWLNSRQHPTVDAAYPQRSKEN